MLTGVLSPENGVRDYFDPLPEESRTIAQDMKARGYDTAYFGKWHLAKRDVGAALVGEAHARMVVPEAERGGFEFWEGFEGGFLLNEPWLHGSRLEQPQQFPGYQSDVLAERAGNWLGQQTAPWFAVVSLEAPHPPYDAAVPEGVERTDPARIVLAPNVPEEDAVRSRATRELAGYYAHIEATDRAIGRLVAMAGADAIVVVTSVHGDMHGAHGKFRKGWPHEESVRVPLVVRRPGGGGVGTSSDELASLVDLPEMTRTWSGGDAWKCERVRAPISMPSVVALHDQCDRVWSGWRSATRKEVNDADGSPWLVFDLKADPFEQRNLAAR